VAFDVPADPHQIVGAAQGAGRETAGRGRRLSAVTVTPMGVVGSRYPVEKPGDRARAGGTHHELHVAGEQTIRHQAHGLVAHRLGEDRQEGPIISRALKDRPRTNAAGDDVKERGRQLAA
jgi:hypothetical protein